MAGQPPLHRSSSGSETFTIPDLVNEALAGRLRVPSFQRPFVWDATDVRDLFDSIYRGFPIGTLLLWRQPLAPEEITFGGVHINAAHPSTDGFMVVDGQQRITALVASLAPIVTKTDDRFEVYFDLNRQRFVGPVRGEAPPRSIPVRQALDSRTLLSWLREHGADLEADDLDLADELAATLRQYRVPAYLVIGDDERLLREVFDRVNSAGKPMTRAQVFHALFANESEPGSPATVVTELRRLRFGSIPENRVVQSLLAIRGGNVARDLHDEFDEDDPTDDPADWYEQTEQALERSIEFLQAEGVLHQLLAPSTLPLPVLAAFFHLHREPEYLVSRLLSRWLWRGWVHGFGSIGGGQTPALRRAIMSINPRKRAVTDAPSEYEAVKRLLDSVPDAPTRDAQFVSVFRTDHAASRMALMALANLGPLSPEGERIDVASSLDVDGVSAVGELVSGNRANLGARGFWRAEWGKVDLYSHARHESFLKSHAVTEEALWHLSKQDLSGFLAARVQEINHLTRNFLDGRIAAGTLVRPPLSSLLVPDRDSE